jgi:hypothetical protein
VKRHLLRLPPGFFSDLKVVLPQCYRHPTVQILNQVGIEAVRALGAELQMRSLRMVFRL